MIMEELVPYSAPKGFKFVPTDAELIAHYLMTKIKNRPVPIGSIRDVNLYDYSPLQLAETHKFIGEEMMFFFTSRERKYPNGNHPKRSTGNGYWKAWGKNKPIVEGGRTIGFKMALVFYEGNAKHGRKTNWLMHEYTINAPTTTRASAAGGMKLNDWVLCKIYRKKRNQNDTEKEKDEAIVSVMDVEATMSTTLYSPSHNALGNWLPGQRSVNMSQSDHSINQSTVSWLADDHSDHYHQSATNYYDCLDDESLPEANMDMLDCVDFSPLFDDELKDIDPFEIKNYEEPFAISASSAAEYFDSLPPGFLFSPSDKELVVDYLREKILNRPLPINRIHVVDLYKHNPQQLTDMHKLHREDAWYFFTRRDRKYPKGSRPNRSVADGYWKAISICHKVMLKKDIVGYKRNFDFYEGKQPDGKKTSWKMQEYTIDNPTTTHTRDANGVRSFDEWALCRIYLNRTCRNVKEQEETEKPDSNTTQKVLKIQDHEEKGCHPQFDDEAGSSIVDENYYYGGSSSSATFNTMPSSNGFEADHSVSTNDGIGIASFSGEFGPEGTGTKTETTFDNFSYTTISQDWSTEMMEFSRDGQSSFQLQGGLSDIFLGCDHGAMLATKLG
ncbi:hypothetical protein FNV43_RR16460 [Rhamnella rubrinervis]|uniref:NAC domain-containing protein n=1 Tax=Rhamnella rubrinervis TaxID=2594499 RepID=A0A8K0GYU4_9ROSA|nr:hypothetical protein FNV43_RR16460 [Rhamnella rubrinervis]